MKMDSPKAKEIINICHEHEKQYGKHISIDYINNQIQIYGHILMFTLLINTLSVAYSNIYFNNGVIIIE